MWFVVSSSNESRKVSYIKWNEWLKVVLVVEHSSHRARRDMLRLSHTYINMYSLTHWTVSSNSLQFYSLNFFAIAFKAFLFISMETSPFCCYPELVSSFTFGTFYANVAASRKKRGNSAVNIGPTHLVHRHGWQRTTQIKYLCTHMNVKWKKGEKKTPNQWKTSRPKASVNKFDFSEREAMTVMARLGNAASTIDKSGTFLLFLLVSSFEHLNYGGKNEIVICGWAWTWCTRPNYCQNPERNTICHIF